ncbi:MAG: sugar phosphate isomerase/epimerase [Armatimonadetes bacterium]|nr:sugar phosphate isomerase/epimerase [Armatimonadota bacterium]
MLLSVFAQALGGDIHHQIRTAAALGFEALELRHAVDGVPLGELAVEQFREICESAAEEGLLVATLAVGTLDQLARHEHVLWHLGELAIIAGARVRVFSSIRPPGANRLSEPDVELFAREAAALRFCAQVIGEASHGGLVMLEAEPDSIANTIARQARLITAAETPEVGYNWDLVNCWRAGEYPWPGPWPLLSERLYGIHLKGAKGAAHNPEEYASMAIPGDDDLPHHAIWATLAAAGFDGPITVDPHYPDFAPADRFDPEPANPDAEVCVRTLAAMQVLRAHALAGAV